jgi:hypothetical protein
MELANELLSMTRGKEISKQSVILMHSLSHMSKVGTESYTEELLLATSKIKSILGQHILVIPLPHLFTAGCTCEFAIRTAAEITTWADKIYGSGGQFLSTTFQKANYLLVPAPGEEMQLRYERLLQLPESQNWPVSKKAWIMGGFDLPARIQPTSVIDEKEIISSLINELRAGAALPLDTEPAFDRMVPVEGGRTAGHQPKLDYLIVGRTGASTMIAEALERKQKKVEIISNPDWRLTSSFVNHLAKEAKVAIEARRPRVVVIAGLEESYLMARYDEVYTVPATRGPDGRHHIHGDLVVANPEAQGKLLGLLEPLLEMTAGIATLIVGPMIRYIKDSCCDDPDHMPNKTNPDFEKKIKRRSCCGGQQAKIVSCQCQPRTLPSNQPGNGHGQQSYQ